MDDLESLQGLLDEALQHGNRSQEAWAILSRSPALRGLPEVAQLKQLAEQYCSIAQQLDNSLVELTHAVEEAQARPERNTGKRKERATTPDAAEALTALQGLGAEEPEENGEIPSLLAEPRELDSTSDDERAIEDDPLEGIPMTNYAVDYATGEVMDEGGDDDAAAGGSSESNGDLADTKKCNCKKSRCLKLYCECFSSGIFCEGACMCRDCLNVVQFTSLVSETRQHILDRSPNAFAPKVSSDGGHKKGCHCKKSRCLKKYCECYQANVPCTDSCRCENCKNQGPEAPRDDSPQESFFEEGAPPLTGHQHTLAGSQGKGSEGRSTGSAGGASQGRQVQTAAAQRAPQPRICNPAFRTSLPLSGRGHAGAATDTSGKGRSHPIVPPRSKQQHPEASQRRAHPQGSCLAVQGRMQLHCGSLLYTLGSHLHADRGKLDGPQHSQAGNMDPTSVPKPSTWAQPTRRSIRQQVSRSMSQASKRLPRGRLSELVTGPPRTARIPAAPEPPPAVLEAPQPVLVDPCRIAGVDSRGALQNQERGGGVVPDLISEAWELGSNLPVQIQQEQPLAGHPQGRGVQEPWQAAGARSEGANDLRSIIEKISSDLPAPMPGLPSGIPDAGVHPPNVDASKLPQPLAGAPHPDLGSLAPASAMLPLHGASLTSPQGSWPKLKRQPNKDASAEWTKLRPSSGNTAGSAAAPRGHPHRASAPSESHLVSASTYTLSNHSAGTDTADDAISPPPPTLSSRALRQTSAAIAAAYHRSQAQLVARASAIKREREEAEVVGAQHLRPRVVSWGTAPAAADERRDLRWAVVRKRQLMEDTRCQSTVSDPLAAPTDAAAAAVKAGVQEQQAADVEQQEQSRLPLANSAVCLEPSPPLCLGNKVPEEAQHNPATETVSRQLLQVKGLPPLLRNKPTAQSSELCQKKRNGKENAQAMHWPKRAAASDLSNHEDANVSGALLDLELKPN